MLIQLAWSVIAKPNDCVDTDTTRAAACKLAHSGVVSFFACFIRRSGLFDSPAGGTQQQALAPTPAPANDGFDDFGDFSSAPGPATAPAPAPANNGMWGASNNLINLDGLTVCLLSFFVAMSGFVVWGLVDSRCRLSHLRKFLLCYEKTDLI